MTDNNRENGSVRYDMIYDSNEDVIPEPTLTLSRSRDAHDRSKSPGVPIEYQSSSIDTTDHPRGPAKPSSPVVTRDGIVSGQASPQSSPTNRTSSNRNTGTRQQKTRSGFLSGIFSFNLSKSQDPQTESEGAPSHPPSLKRSNSVGKAKALTRKISQAYFKQLHDTAKSKFHDWSREELIELLVGPPFHYEIRNELHIQTTALRDVADELYKGSPVVPLRPHLPTDYEITLYNVMARRIQDAWIDHIIWQRDEERALRDLISTNQMNRMRNSVDFREADDGEGKEGEGKRRFDDDMYLLAASREEVIADEDVELGRMLSTEEIEAIEQMFREQEDEEALQQSSFEQGIEPGSSSALQQIVVTTQPDTHYDASAVGPSGGEVRSPKGTLIPEGLRAGPSALEISVPPRSPTTTSAGTRTARGTTRINVFDIPWSAPDVNVAKNYANYVQPRKNRRKGVMYDFKTTTTGRYCCLDGLGEQFDMWEEGQVSEFAQFGSGVTNYFKFIKWGFWLFTLLTIAALPMLVLNYVASSGNNQNSGLKQLAKTTLGNLAVTTANTTFSVTVPGCVTTFLMPGTCTLNGSNLALLYSIIDIVISAIVMVAFLWLNYFQQYEEEELNQTLVKPSMFSIAVTHLPKDVTESEIIHHFLRLLNATDRDAIASISMAYNNQIEIDLCFQRGELMREKVRLVHHYRKTCTQRRLSKNYNEKKDDEYLAKEKEKMLTKMKHINTELTKKEKALEVLSSREDGEENQPIVAFITFDKAKDRDYILSLYENMNFWQYCCWSDQLKLNHHHWLHVAEAPDPSVIIWENLMFARSQRLQRRFVTTFCSLLLVILSIIMIFASKYVEEKATNNGANKKTLCPSGFDGWTTDDQKNYVDQYPDTIHCYCDKENTLAQARDSFCQRYLSQNVSAQVLIYFASFMILLVNYLMEKLIKRFSKWEKHHTNDGMGNSIFIRLFFLKYINSAAIFLINNNNVILHSLFGIEVSSAPEFTANWYNSVGVTIILVQLGDVINCHGDSLWSYWVYSRTKKEAELHPDHSLTQDELNQKFIGPKFDLAFNYAELLSTLFVSLTFATGIPLLYPIAAANFLIYYLTEKYLFIHMYKIPPHFNTTVGKRATLLIPMALGIHLGMSIWMLSNHKLFSDTPTSFSDDDNGSGSSSNSATLEQYYYSSNSLVSHHDFTNYTRKRVVTKTTLPLLIAFAVVLLVWIGLIGFRYLRNGVDRFYNFWCKCSGIRMRSDSAEATNNNNRGKTATNTRGSDIEQGLLWSNTEKKKSEPTRYLVTYTRAIQRNLIKGLATYNILQNPIYKEAFGITWKFAVDHNRVRSVRGLKLKALNPQADDNIDRMETSSRPRPAGGDPSIPPGRRGMTLRTAHKPTGEEKTPETSGKKTVRIDQSTPRNRSFYSTMLNDRPNTPSYSSRKPGGTTPTAETAAKVNNKKTTPTNNNTTNSSNSNRERTNSAASAGSSSKKGDSSTTTAAASSSKKKPTAADSSSKSSSNSKKPPVAPPPASASSKAVELTTTATSGKKKGDSRKPHSEKHHHSSGKRSPSPVIQSNNNDDSARDDSTIGSGGSKTISKFYPEREDDNITTYSYGGGSPHPVGKESPSAPHHIFPALHRKKDLEMGDYDSDDNKI